MGAIPVSHEERARVAQAAVEGLGPSPNRHARLHVSCPHSHSVAIVYATDQGLVFRSVVQARSHGRRDRVDTGHHATRNGQPWFDLLDAGDGPAVDDALPAGCECGPRTLSRRLVRRFVADGERHVVLT